MTNNEAAKWIQLYIDLARLDPTTGEAAYLNDDDRKTIEAMEMAINALTAQSETHSCDLIDRRALMKEFSDFVRASNNSDFAPRPTWNDAVSLVKSMPPVQSLSSCAHENDQDLQPTCNNLATDCISRKAAIDACHDYEDGEGAYAYGFIVEERLRNLPSAQPERTRMSNKEWIDFLVVQFDISRTSAKEMLHGMMKMKKEDNFKRDFNPLR